MSKYTTEVRYICESLAGESESKGYNDVDTIIGLARSSIFGNYPIFDENYRAVLETKILRHYYTREICAETFGLWKLWLNNTMNEIMPYYNKLYESEALSFNPLYDVDYSIERNGSNNRAENETGSTSGNRTSKTDKNASNNRHFVNEDETIGSTKALGDSSSNNIANNTSTTTDLYSDTPQGSLSGIDSNTYLTNARKTNNESNSNDSGVSTNTYNENSNNNKKSESNEDNISSNLENINENSDEQRERNNYITSVDAYLEHIKGKQGGTSYSKMLKEYRDTFINIDMQIINKLSNLFFGLW